MPAVHMHVLYTFMYGSGNIFGICEYAKGERGCAATEVPGTFFSRIALPIRHIYARDERFVGT